MDVAAPAYMDVLAAVPSRQFPRRTVAYEGLFFSTEIVVHFGTGLLQIMPLNVVRARLP